MTIARQFQLHPTLWIFLLIAFFTGTFVQLFILLSIVFWHELGHYCAARFFGWRIERVVFWAFGGVMQTDEQGTRPVKEELLVTLFGPLQHLFIYIFILTLSYFHLLPPALVADIHYYNFIVFFFNLLPIYPLDGGKFILFSLSHYLPYRQAYRQMLNFSILSLLLLIVFQLYSFPFTFTATLLLVFLLFEAIKARKKEFYTFMRFLLKRFYIEESSLATKRIEASGRTRLLDLFNRFYRNKYHHIYVDSTTYISEKDTLDFYFKEQRLQATLQDALEAKEK